MRAIIIRCAYTYIPEARERDRQYGTLEYTQKILFRPVNHQRRYGSLVAAFILITSRPGDARCSSVSPVARRFQLSTADTLIDRLVYDIIVDNDNFLYDFRISVSDEFRAPISFCVGFRKRRNYEYIKKGKIYDATKL